MEEERRQLETLQQGKELHKSQRSTPAEHVPKVKFYKCEDCNVEFPDNNDNVRKHIQAKHPRIDDKVPTIRCVECKIPFKSENDLKGHISAMHKSFSTSMAAPNTAPAKQIITPKVIKNRRLQQLRQFNCHECPFEGNSARDLFHHVQQTLHKTDDLSVQCFNCDKTLHNWRELMVHRRAHHYNDLQMCKFITSGETCRYGEERCFFRHKTAINTQIRTNNKVVVDIGSDEDFPRLQPAAPPDLQVQNLTEMMKQMKMQTDLMQKMQSQMLQFVQMQSVRTPGV